MKREEKQKQIEQSILKAIFEKIKDKDLDSITSNEIAEAANVSKRTLYKYFNSKTEMYLGLVKESFTELNQNMDEAVNCIKDKDAVHVIECIGISYLRFLLDNPVKGKIITNFNENDYKKDYPAQVKELSKMANQYDLADYVKSAYKIKNMKPSVSIEGTVMFLWSTIQGLGALLLSKKSWIEEYYNIEENKLIEEVMDIIKQIFDK